MRRDLTMDSNPAALTLSGRWLSFVRAVWLSLIVPALAFFFLAIPAVYSQRGDPPEAVRQGLAQLGVSAGVYATYVTALLLAFALICFMVAGVIALRRADDGMAMFISLLLVLVGSPNHPNMQALVESYPVLSVPATLFVFLAYTALILFFFLFPDGRFVPYRMVVPVAVWVAALLVTWFLPGSSLANPSSWTAMALLVGLPAGIGTQIYRYRKISSPMQRQQTKWVLLGAAVAAVGQLLGILLSSLGEASRTGISALFYDLAGVTVVTLALLSIPLTIGIAILRYRLWDIDLIINRTLVYGALTTIVIGLYVLVVGGLGTLLQTRGSLLISLLGAGLVAVLFAPVRDRLQRGVNRLMYGVRDDPYVAVSRLGERLESTLAPAAVLPSVVQMVREVLKLPYAAIEVERNGGLEFTAVSGEPVDDPLRLPLVYGGETVGRLVLGPRYGEESFSLADRRLMEDLARQAGVAVHAARLTEEAIRLSADLQRSRERLVTAREEERRRLRRDLHDGLGPRLAGLTMRAEAARDLVSEDPGRAESLLGDLVEQAQDAVADIRRVVHGLRPPALDALGLSGALRSHASGQDLAGLRVAFEAPEKLPPLPAAVEVAAYLIATEALNNVTHHAGARNCTVRLALDEAADTLSLEVTDDGRGIAEEDRGAGVGLSSMRERARELGGNCIVEALPSGGTCVRAHLPCEAGEEALKRRASE